MGSETEDKIDSFTKLVVWQVSHKLVIATLRFCERLSFGDPIRNQMERSCMSITANIAEGFGRQSVADKKHFYIIARGSAYELQDQLLVARDIGKLNEVEFRELAKLSLDSIRLLHGLIRSINKARNATY
jgi:four helix bundle protein